MTRRYDQLVQSRTVRRPGLDAAVLRLRPSYRGLAVTLDGTGRVGSLDPFTGGAAAILEAARNVACAGGEPLGFTDCLNFGNPEKPEIGWELAESIEGMAQACEALGAADRLRATSRSTTTPTAARSIRRRSSGCVGLVPDVRRIPGAGEPGRRDPARLDRDPGAPRLGAPGALRHRLRARRRRSTSHAEAALVALRRRRRPALLARARRLRRRPRRRARRGCAALGRRRPARPSATTRVTLFGEGCGQVILAAAAPTRSRSTRSAPTSVSGGSARSAATRSSASRCATSEPSGSVTR